MATLPEVVGFDTDIVIASQPSKTWIIDRNTMQVACMDDGLEAVRQAVEIALDVERFRWTIYSANFGSELDELVGQDEALITAEIPRLVEGALSQDDRVVQVEDYVFTRTGPDSMHVSFTVRTVYGDLIEEMQI
jgi:CYTH domain-containing protein